MSNIANIVAFDGAATPVSHTLVPADTARNGNVVEASWKESLSNVPDAAQVTAGLRKEKLGSGVFRNAFTVSVPVMEVAGPANAQGYTAAPKVAFTDKFILIGMHHPRSTIASRRLARQLALNVFGGIATSVTPVVTGPSSEAFDQLVMPT